jgi:hypothetical protein
VLSEISSSKSKFVPLMPIDGPAANAEVENTARNALASKVFLNIIFSFGVF